MSFFKSLIIGSLYAAFAIGSWYLIFWAWLR